jgi:hypothetical protein
MVRNAENVRDGIPDGQLQVPGDDARLLIVPGRVPSQLQDLGGQILHDLETGYCRESDRYSMTWRQVIIENRKTNTYDLRPVINHKTNT